jgi:predicted transposase YbfD/YdcC
MEVPTLTIACHEEPPPADDIFLHDRCPQPVPARSPCPGSGPAEKTRAPASAGRTARRGDRGGDRRVTVVRRDRAVGRRCRPRGAGRAGGVRGPAEVSTFRRAFALVSPGVLDRVLGAWLYTRAVQAGGRLVIAIDGKTVRGAKGKTGKAPHLVAALAHGIGAVLGQVAVDAKSNEIPAVRELLKAFADLAGAVLTIDAMHTQHDTAQAILGRGADYVMTVKGNMPTLYKRLKKLPWAAVPATSAVSTDHGRRACRTIKVALVPAWIELPGAAQVAQLRRTVTTKGKKTVEVVYLITSDGDASPATLAAWIRGHWEIENKLHWVRDVTYQEDKSLVRTGNAPRVMASLRSLAISLLRLDGHPNIAAANRHHARDPQRTLRLLQTA